jgi:phenylacetate-coenzyme A ligase PaaK-like adenylate-forming protein
MRIELHHRPSRLPLSNSVLAVGRVRASAGSSGSPSASPTSRGECARWYRQSAPTCRPMGSIAKPAMMGTFVGLSQNGLDPEVAPA